MSGRIHERTSTKHVREPSPRVVALLREINRAGSLRNASRVLGMVPGNAHRLLRSEERRLGLRLVEGFSGGQDGGGSQLTRIGREVAGRRISVPRPTITWWPCRVIDPARRLSPLLVSVPGAGITASVAPIGAASTWMRRLRRGADLELGIVPEAVTIVPKRTKVRGSARNVWPGRIVSMSKPVRFGVQFISLKVGHSDLSVSVTASAVSQLGLRAGSIVNVLLKATALRLRKRIG